MDKIPDDQRREDLEKELIGLMQRAEGVDSVSRKGRDLVARIKILRVKIDNLRRVDADGV